MEADQARSASRQRRVEDTVRKLRDACAGFVEMTRAGWKKRRRPCSFVRAGTDRDRAQKKFLAQIKELRTSETRAQR